MLERAGNVKRFTTVTIIRVIKVFILRTSKGLARFGCQIMNWLIKDLIWKLPINTEYSHYHPSLRAARGATTLGITTFCITSFRIRVRNVTFSECECDVMLC
jgi:hypothetical protein